MASICEMQFATRVPDDLAMRLRPSGIEEILAVLWKGYELLRNSRMGSYDVNTDEDVITQDWYEEVYRLWTDENRATCITINIGLMHQYSDKTLGKKRGKNPTIDFCFREWGVDDSYFGIESKKLMSQRKDLVQRYMDTGVENFVSGRYGSHSSESCIAAYVMSGSVLEEVEALAPCIQRTSFRGGLARKVAVSYPQYYSRHLRRLDSMPITLHHLFLDFISE